MNRKTVLLLVILTFLLPSLRATRPIAFLSFDSGLNEGISIYRPTNIPSPILLQFK